MAAVIRHHELPRCPRCGRLLETCTFFDEAGCVGVPLPEDMQRERTPWTETQKRYWSALCDYQDRARVVHNVRTYAHDWRERPERMRKTR